jgi:hypothetical protein
VTKDPKTHPELHVFLQRVVGFDTVDDESKSERRIHKKFPYPRLWDAKESPPYSYWLAVPPNYATPYPDLPSRVYYVFANMASLNNWRRLRGFSESSLVRRTTAPRLTRGRYLCVSPACGRSRRHRSPNSGVPDITLYLAWHPPSQGSGAPISVLPEADRDRNEPDQQQCALPDIRAQSAARVLQDGAQHQPKY